MSKQTIPPPPPLTGQAGVASACSVLVSMLSIPFTLSKSSMLWEVGCFNFLRQPSWCFGGGQSGHASLGGVRGKYMAPNRPAHGPAVRVVTGLW